LLAIRSATRRGGVLALLLLFCLLLWGCGGAAQGPDGGDGPADRPSPGRTEVAAGEQTAAPAPGGRRVEALLPEDVLSEKELEREAPGYRDWYRPAGEQVRPVSGAGGSSAGAIPAVKPFNFGRDPGGPEDKTLYLTVPKIGLFRVPVYNSTSEEDLRRSAVHVPATGFPWQEGANVFIAGHRLGYAGTGSYLIFYDLPKLEPGDEIILEDAAGGRYVYRVFREVTVGPENVEVMNPVEGKSVVSLQTCTLPDYSERIIVQGELVSEKPA
jgi:sortase A